MIVSAAKMLDIVSDSCKNGIRRIAANPVVIALVNDFILITIKDPKFCYHTYILSADNIVTIASVISVVFLASSVCE